jgi:hypothetical protein
MLVLVVLLTILLIAVVTASSFYVAMDNWRNDCLIAEHECAQLREHLGDLRSCLATYERITDITAATVQAVQGRVGQ